VLTQYLAGTGSRKCRPTPGLLAWLDGVLTERAKKSGLVLICGMAEGFEELLAGRALAHSIPFVAAVPNRGYGPYYW
jgi:hypothetical protein